MSVLNLAIVSAMAIAAPGSAAAERDAAIALVNLNNYIDGLNFSDACLGRSDAAALDGISPRIEAARQRIVARYPSLQYAHNVGDTDWVCQRSERRQRVSRKAIQKQVLLLVEKLEAVAAR